MITYMPKTTRPKRKSRNSQQQQRRIALRARATRAKQVALNNQSIETAAVVPSELSRSERRLAKRHGRENRGKRGVREKRSKRDPRVASATSPTLTVTSHVDQTGQNEWLNFRVGEDEKLFLLDTLLTTPNVVYRGLALIGIRAFSGKTRSAIVTAAEEAEKGPAIYVATTPGLHLGAYVAVDGKVFGKASANRFHVNLPSRLPLAQKGSYRGWRRTVRDFATGQPIFKLVLCVSFMGPVIELFGWSNSILELVSTTSTAKTTGLNFAGSSWGAPLNTPGSLAISLRNTDAKLEQVMMHRGGAIFLGDEVNHLGSEAKQAERLTDFAFALAEGREKGRYTDKDNGHVPIAHMPSLLTSNISIAILAKDTSPARLGAVLVRLITIPADAGAGYGVLARLPRGYDTAADAIHALEEALTRNYGHAGPLFIRRLFRAWKRDERDVRRRVGRWVRQFLAATKVDMNDGPAVRVARALARVYATGQLAQHLKVLPAIGLRRSLLICYRNAVGALPVAHRPQSQLAPLDLIKSYVEANRDRLVDLDWEVPRVRNRDLNDHPGWLKTRQVRQCVFLRKKVFERLVGSADAASRELQGLGLLQSNTGRQLQVKVRRNSKHDRVYAVVID